MKRRAVAFGGAMYVVLAEIACGQVSFQGLGDLPGGQFNSGTVDVSGDGAVVVGNGHSDTDLEAEGLQLLGGFPLRMGTLCSI